MYKAMTKKQAAAFRKDVLAVFGRLGVKHLDDGGMYSDAVETVAGTLRLNIHDNWIACRFHDVARAKQHVCSGPYARLNPYSGKWNWDGVDCVGQFEYEARMLLQAGNVM
jgi:hypothetical protein